MVVAGVGIAAVAVLAAGGERFLVVALDRADVARFEQRPDLLRIRAEAAEVAQAVDRIDRSPRGLFEQRGEGEMVVVDPAEDEDAPVRPLDRSRIGIRGEAESASPAVSVAFRKLPSGTSFSPQVARPRCAVSFSRCAASAKA
jgi:hypothetical protein